ncbi:MAG: methyltransferase domain-containing protein [Verrucomicrobia bacterium]|nr:methyltransferase domain-containing protein [Verrucomicrobiota bacterium]
MRIEFATRVLKLLQANRNIALNTSILAVCAGEAERDLFVSLGLTNVTITSLDPVVTSGVMAPFTGSLADVRKLPFDAEAFDWVFVSDGLHHCDSPHAALVEMYRVARTGVIVFESRDNLLIRLAVARGLTEQYEISAVADNRGECAGVNYTSVPNYVYRWTERDFEKTIACADPTGKPSFQYFYGFNAPVRAYSGIKSVIYKTAVLAGKVFACLFKKQSNSFCMVAFKPTELFPWLVRGVDNKPVFRKVG